MVTSKGDNKSKSKLINIGLVLALVVGVYLIVSSSLVYYGHLQDMERYRKEVEIASSDEATPEQRQIAEGKDEEDRTDALTSYTVPASHPRAIYIDKVNLSGIVLPMGLNPDRSVQAPINIFDTGWYTNSSKPGEPGVSLIVGHASGPSREGLFAYVDTLAPGDQVVVELGDGSRLNYQVESKVEQPLEDVDMGQVLSADDDEDRLNLITCSGEWLQDMTTFDKRTIIYTRRI